MVNELNVHHFIAKPWNPYFLKAALGQAIDCNEISISHRELSARAREMMPDRAAPGLAAPDPVLVVDDDPGVLHALYRALRSLKDMEDTPSAQAATPLTDIEILTARSADEAMDLLGQRSFSCILADQNMPGMSGLALLRWCVQKQPDCLRLLISGGIGQGNVVVVPGLGDIAKYLALVDGIDR